MVLFETSVILQLYHSYTELKQKLCSNITSTENNRTHKMCKTKIVDAETKTDQADEIIQEHNTSYSLVTMDLHMPSMKVTFLLAVGLFLILIAAYKIAKDCSPWTQIIKCVKCCCPKKTSTTSAAIPNQTHNRTHLPEQSRTDYINNLETIQYNTQRPTWAHNAPPQSTIEMTPLTQDNHQLDQQTDNFLSNWKQKQKVKSIITITSQT